VTVVRADRAGDAVDEKWMQIALELARRGQPSPNPPVGAVVVQDGRPVGYGWHDRAGGPHAEVVALACAGARARSAVLYVTLEPCNHHGRTPPCVEVIVAARVRRVVVACLDPNPHVAGGGAERLRRAGIAVDIGVLPGEGARLIAGWVSGLHVGDAVTQRSARR
jgi:diaminohydroxyphosphoribosylaminopyrimidine deaminase/5-amino-6-(5-phosphoribosylamino)uracil reductase